MTVQFNHKVKYAGTWFPANTSFEVKDEDVESLVKDGAVVIETTKNEETKVEKEEVVEQVEEKEEKEEKEETEKIVKRISRKRG